MKSRTLKIDGEEVTFYAVPEQGAWYADPTDGGPVGTLYAPMNADGSMAVEEVGVIEVAYEDAGGKMTA